MTWIKTYDVYRRASAANIGTPLTSLLLVDGKPYIESCPTLAQSDLISSRYCLFRVRLSSPLPCRNMNSSLSARSIIGVVQILAMVTSSVDSRAESLNSPILHQIAGISVDFVPTYVLTSFSFDIPAVLTACASRRPALQLSATAGSCSTSVVYTTPTRRTMARETEDPKGVQAPWYPCLTCAS